MSMVVLIGNKLLEGMFEWKVFIRVFCLSDSDLFFKFCFFLWYEKMFMGYINGI